VSASFEPQYPGIVIQAVGGTFGTLAGLLLAFQSGLIRATENFKLGIVAATGGICLVYLISMIGSLFGFPIPFIHAAGPVGIAFSLFVVVIAALNLVLDFDFIEQAAEHGAPKYLEWYGAFALMVTLVWLYMEILRLLAKPALEKPDCERPAAGIPQDIAEHMRLMCDIVVLGFQTDTTRITSLKFNNDHSAQRFPNLPKHGGKPGDGIDYMIHHLLSHTDNEDWLRVNQFFVEQTAYLAGRLDAIREGERTLLDNTLLLHTSSMLHGQHENSRLPAILLGGAGAGVRGGRVLDYTDKPDRQMCRLFMSLMDKMGDRQTAFGDAKAMLDEV
jgi:hypothetical protein